VAALLILVGAAAGIWLTRPGNALPDFGQQVQAPRAEEPPAKPPEAKPPAQQDPPKAEEPPKPPAPPEEKRPADSDATAFIHRFMQARMSGDAAGLDTLVDPAAPGRAGIRLSVGGARITGYSASLLGSGDPESFIFRLRVAFATAQPGAEVAVENVRVSWKGGFKVAGFEDIPRDSLALVAAGGGKLAVHRGQDTAIVADLGALPATAKPYGAGPDSEFGVGKDGWSVASPSLSGSKVLWITRGLHPLLGVSDTNWSGAAVATHLDLMFEATGVDAAWSPAGDRYVAVTVAQPSGATTLFVWDTNAGERFGPDLVTLTGSPDFTVKNLRWQANGNVVMFDLEKGGATTGPWQYSVSTKVVTNP